MSRSTQTSHMQSKKHLRIFIVVASSLLFCTMQLRGQSTPEQTTVSAEQRAAAMEQRLNEVTSALNQTQQTLERSMEEIKRLRSQLESLRAQMPKAAAADRTPTANSAATANDIPASNSSPADAIGQLHEEQEAIQSEIKLHEQTKIETASKYSLRVTGLILFNAFSNAGVVDNVDLPGIAYPRPPGTTHGSSGASLRQTLIGIEGTGPRLWGARSAAELSIDFFGDQTYNQSGYSSSMGDIVRLRQGKVNLDWSRTTVEAGMTTPLISPRSPTSFANVAEPSLAGAGNLWAWSPQVRLEQSIPIAGQRSMGLEFGLLDPPSSSMASASIQSLSPGEASRHPGVEGRISYHGGKDAAGSWLPLEFGLAAYSSDQHYGTISIHSWAATADWQLPIYRWFALSGEAYRGRALGGLGGGVYKDVLTGTAPGSNAPVTNGVDAVGGWGQWKIRFSPIIEANAVFGLDDALASNFRRLTLPTSMPSLSLYSRNSMVVGNIIFRPKTYLIFSPEFRRIMTWRNTGAGYTANIFTLSAGYQF